MLQLKIRLILMNFLEYAVWGAYLTSMGSYLVSVGLAGNIGLFYAVQGIVSLFMPALIGIIADRLLPAQKVLSLCHLVAGVSMAAAGWYGMSAGANVDFGILFSLYTLSVAFFMPTIGLSNSVAFSGLTKAGGDTVKDFRYHRFYLFHVVCRCDRFPIHIRTVFCVGRFKHCFVSVFAHIARLPGKQRKEKR